MPARLARPRGTSALEVIIACLLLGTVSTGAVSLMLASYRHYLDSDAAASLNDRVLQATTDLQRELKISRRSTTAIFAAPQGLVFASPRRNDHTIAFDPDNLQPVWQKWVCYYLEPDGQEHRLIRKEEPLASPTTTPPTVPSSKSTNHFRSAVSGGRVVARGVATWEIKDGTPMTLKLGCKEVVHRGTSSAREFEFELTTQVALQN